MRRGAEGPGKSGRLTRNTGFSISLQKPALPKAVQSTVSLQASERAESSGEESALPEKHVFPD